MKKSLLSALIAACLSPRPYWLLNPCSQDIRVEGIQRTEAGTVFSYLPVKVGDTLNDEKAASRLRRCSPRLLQGCPDRG
jgi:outer membrane protein insertion porin family